MPSDAEPQLESDSVADDDPVVLTPSAIVAGGDALARADDGAVVFIEGALPGETVTVAITERRRDLRRGRVLSIDVPSPQRVSPPCEYHVAGCGGCPWQHINPDAQPTFRRDIVADALRRIARIELPPISTVSLPETGYRTSVRTLVVDGRAALRRRHSHEPISVEHCLIAHPLINDLLDHGRFGAATEVVIRASVATGERLVLADPANARMHLPPDVVKGPRARIYETVEGRSFRISARSFFQARPDGAAALTSAVRSAVGAEKSVVDLYAGVGLLGALLDNPTSVTAVEGSRAAVADAQENLAHVHGLVVHSDVRRWRPIPVDVVIADPGRSGLQAAGVKVVTGCAPARVVLVSCDAAALARDAKLLGDDGYAIVEITMIDMFGHTPHVECVTVFDRR